MFQIKRMLVALDRSEIDGHIARFVYSAAAVVAMEEIVFVHVAPPEKGKRRKVSDLPSEAASELESYCQRIADENRPEGAKVSVRVEVTQGDPISGLLKKSKEHQVDMIAVGRKSAAGGTGQTARMLARKAPCSVFYVPQNAKPDFSRILLPIDFSEFSRMAVERCVLLSKSTKMSVTTLNIYTLPEGYTSSGKTKEEFAAIMEKNARKRYEHFMKQFDTEGLVIEPRFVLDTRKAFAKIIFNCALIEDARIIAIGSRGKDNVAAKLLGSTTEQLLLQNAVIPTLVLKNKGRNTSIFKALFNI